MAAGKKNAARLGAYLVFCDESGFLIMPNLAKTWAPRGQTPLLRHRTRRQRVSAISAISVSPQRQRLGLYYRLYEHNIGQREVCQFLSQLLAHLRGDVVVLLDNATIHRGQRLRRLQQRNERLHVEYFPGYAPELNPDEGVWAYAKRVLANGQPDDVKTLHRAVRSTLEKLRASRVRLRGCIEHSELPLFLR